MGRVILGYGASSYSGWGVEALNMMLHWPEEVLTAVPDVGATMRYNDPRTVILEDRMAKSAAFRRDFASKKLHAAKVADPVFIPLGATLDHAPCFNSTMLSGTPTIAFPYIEFPDVSEQHKEKLRKFDRIVVASAWNKQLVESWGFEATLVHQAIDTVLFNPYARHPNKDGRFRVFSGGKAEYRKGQDIALKAFARFAEKHDEALLVAAWSSPWPELSRSFDNCDIGAVPGAVLAQPNYNAWAQSVGIKPHQFQNVPPTPNCQMIDILGPIDVAIFPNRSEGGTNQVAMECIACGIPTILSHETGHVDLKETGCLFTTSEDGFVSGLELAYDTKLTKPELTDTFSWNTRIESLKELL